MPTSQQHGQSFLIKPIVLSIHLAFTGLLACATQYTLAETASITMEYHIAQGSLTQALNQFALQSGVKLSVDSNHLSGIKSQGLQGHYSIEQGFQELLKDTKYQIVKIDHGYTLVEKNMSTPQVRNMGQLKTIDVTADSSRKNNDIAQLPVIIITADDNTSYAVKKATIGKTEQSLKEIPQSVSVMSKQQIEDQGFTSIAEVLNQSTGVMAYGYSGSENYQIRFSAANVQVNGVPQSDNISNEDPALYEAIEVLRGPSGLLTGSGDPSGSINFVRKRPTAHATGSLAISGGSWGSYRSEFDVSNKLNESGSLRGRLVAVQNNKGKFRDAEKNDEKTTVYAAVDYDLTDKATFGISGTYINEDYINFWGLPLNHYGNVPSRNSFVGYNTPSKRDQKQFSADFKYQFDNNWVAKAAYNHNEVDHKNFGMYSYAALDENGLTTAGVGHIQQAFTNQSFDMNVSGSFQLLGKEHQLLFGYNQWKNDSLSGSRYVAIQDWNVLNNHDYSQYVNTNIINKSRNQTEQSGFYASTKIKLLDPLTLILGGRWSDYRQTNSTAKANNEFTPYTGIVWDINPQFTWYASYADSFVPQTEKNYLEQTLEPRVGWQIETGIKAEFLDGALNTNAAIFQIRDKNRSMEDLDHIGCNTDTGKCYRAAGEVQARGFEIEITGKPTAQLNLTAGYTYNDIKYLSDEDSTNIGQRFASDTIPKQLFKLWSMYQFDEQLFSGALAGVDIGLGMQAQTGLYNSSLKQGGFAIASARIGYQINPNWQASLQVNNLFDKTYFNYPGNTIFYNIYGEPRNFMLTLRAKY